MAASFAGDKTPADLWKQRSQDYNKLETLRDPTYLLSKVWSLAGRLHPSFKCGVLEKDAYAHILVWNKNNPVLWPGSKVRDLYMCDAQLALEHVIVSGVDKGSPLQISSSDEAQRAAVEARARVKSLLKRAGFSA
jgi:hypothetical protein